MCAEFQNACHAIESKALDRSRLWRLRLSFIGFSKSTKMAYLIASSSDQKWKNVRELIWFRISCVLSDALATCALFVKLDFFFLVLSASNLLCLFCVCSVQSCCCSNIDSDIESCIQISCSVQTINLFFFSERFTRVYADHLSLNFHSILVFLAALRLGWLSTG